MNSPDPSRRLTTVKLVDVAGAAGVSLATASRALSSPQLVRDVTLKRVHDAAARLGYVPHGAARALASQRTRTIGAVFPPLDNPIFATGTQALAQELTSAGYTLLVASHQYDERAELDAARRLLERGVDGMVLVGLRHDPALFDLLEQSGVPFELTWAIDTQGRYFSVGVDHRRASADMANYLISLGHTEFAVIAGEVDTNDRASLRLAGVRDALLAAGLELPDDRVEEAPFTVRSGRAAFLQLKQRAPGFSALVCGNDVLAIGSIQECKEQGIDVPSQISVVGFDDIDMAGAVTPALTTVSVPSAQIGRAAGQRLLDRLAGKAVPQSEKFPTKMVIRHTVSEPQKAG